MEVCRKSSGLLLLLGLSLLATTLQGVQGEVESEGPSESECRPYIEKALKELETGEAADTKSSETGDSREDLPTVEITDDTDRQNDEDGDNDTNEDGQERGENEEVQAEIVSEQENAQESEETTDTKSTEDQEGDTADEQTDQSPTEDDTKSEEEAAEDEQTAEQDDDSKGDDATENVEAQNDAIESVEAQDDGTESVEAQASDIAENLEAQSDEATESVETQATESVEDQPEAAESIEVQGDQPESTEGAGTEDKETEEDQGESAENQTQSAEQEDASQEGPEHDQPEGEDSKDDDNTKEDNDDDSKDDDQIQDASVEGPEAVDTESKEEDQGESKEGDAEPSQEVTGSVEGGESVEEVGGETKSEEDGSDNETEENVAHSLEDVKDDDTKEEDIKEDETTDDTKKDDTEEDDTNQEQVSDDTKEESGEEDGGDAEKSVEESESAPEEELSLDIDIPTELRPRDHVEKLLKLDEDSSEIENIINRVSQITLRELKKLYENAIKPLEVLYKYRDLSNRHFGDAEIFSKPLILFMGPWSGGKSSIINYLVNNEYNETSLKTGAEPSPAYFNILMYGDEPEIIEGTELAADFTFAGLQKFGQGLEERLRGVKLPSRLLEKVNIVEIPGILEVRKQVSRVFPFNDACQWFIDRADIIFLIYDPSKLDVGPETEAILDQLKGREHQTRIILNKADQVKPEELMRVQGALIWNISPLMSSPQPPVMYTTSLWSRPYEPWAPVRLLQAQERAFLRDLRGAVDKRIENKIASARRFAVRVRNHAKMVDCYLTTYYNHKSVFGNKKQVADEIIEHPQDYHIYEGLSTLTNISRYDLPDPDVYRDFFKLNPLYDFQQLSATCTYFRGCPINRLDIAIAYDLPELVGTHKKMVESALAEAGQSTAAPGS